MVKCQQLGKPDGVVWGRGSLLNAWTKALVFPSARDMVEVNVSYYEWCLDL